MNNLKNEYMRAIHELECSQPKREESQTPPRQEARKEESPAATELNRAIELAEESKAAIEKFVADHPYLMAPNLTSMMTDCLQESVVTMKRVRDQKESQ